MITAILTVFAVGAILTVLHVKYINLPVEKEG